MNSVNQLKIALVYDRVNTPYGGAEKVLLALHKIFPKAPLYTSVYDSDRARWADVFTVKTSFLQKIPFAKKNHRLLAPLMPLAFEYLDLSEYDIVISITSAEAKGVLTTQRQLHICYLLTPTRYLYSHQESYLNSIPGSFLLKPLAKKLLSYLKWWDLAAAVRPDAIIPISNLIKQRSQKFYQRETAAVIYPPVDSPSKKSFLDIDLELPSQPYYLVISRLVSYKKIDLAVRACQKLKKNLVIVGTGPEKRNLRQISQPTTVFLNSVNDQQRTVLIKNCQALLMPGVEDFGITALEAVSLNKPVVIHQNSGVAELLTDRQNSLFLKELTVSHLSQTLSQLERIKFDFTNFNKNMRKYTRSQFQTRFKRIVFDLWHQHERRI